MKPQGLSEDPSVGRSQACFGNGANRQSNGSRSKSLKNGSQTIVNIPFLALAGEDVRESKPVDYCED